MLMTNLQFLTDDELTTRIATLSGTERAATASLVAHLAELESRDLHLAMGFRSLYGYCRTMLHLSEHEAYNRMEAAHAVRRFPVIVPMVAEGLLHLTAVRLLAPHLGDENHLALLGGAIHKSKVEVKELLARWFPKPEVRTSIRRVAAPAAADVPTSFAALVAAPGPRPVAVPAPASVAAQGAPLAAPMAGDERRGFGTPPVTGAARESAPGKPVIPPRPAERRKASMDPRSAESHAVRLTARRATIERLRRAQELLSHAVPDGDVDEILFRALGALIEREERTIRPARQSAPSGDAPARTAKAESRHVPADLEREVRARDSSRCAFVSTDGRRCGERRFLELHHLQPWIVGGPPTTTNLALRCRAHNAYEWKVYVASINVARDAAPTRSGTSRSPRDPRPAPMEQRNAAVP
jgi:hypothetical protein